MYEGTCAVVTGASGFLGGHLVAALERLGVTVVTMGVGPGGAARVHLKVDRLADATGHLTLLRGLPRAPAWIFHVAGTTRAEHMDEVNVAWARALLDAARRLPAPPTVLLVGSAAEYGPQHDNPATRCGSWVDEETPCAPASAYGRSKLAQTEAGLRAAARQPVVVCRPFNILGRGMPEHLALASFVRQARALPPAGSGQERRIRTGPLNAVRDFMDADDCARFMARLASDPRAHGEVVNLCTGIGTSMSELVATLIEQLEPPVELESAAPANDRPDVVVGATDKLRRLDIQPRRCDIVRCIRDMLNA